MNEPSAWAMSILSTGDPAGARRFYSAVFGWGAQAFDAVALELTMWRLPGYVGGEPEQPVPRDRVAVMASLGGLVEETFRARVCSHVCVWEKLEV